MLTPTRNDGSRPGYQAGNRTCSTQSRIGPSKTIDGVRVCFHNIDANVQVDVRFSKKQDIVVEFLGVLDIGAVLFGT